MIFTEQPLTKKYILDGIEDFSYSPQAVQNWIDTMFERDYETTLKVIEAL